LAQAWKLAPASLSLSRILLAQAWKLAVWNLSLSKILLAQAWKLAPAKEACASASKNLF